MLRLYNVGLSSNSTVLYYNCTVDIIDLPCTVWSYRSILTLGYILITRPVTLFVAIMIEKDLLLAVFFMCLFMCICIARIFFFFSYRIKVCTGKSVREMEKEGSPKELP